jgi:hypothetical protein
MGTGEPLPLSQQQARDARIAINQDFGNLNDAFQITSWPTDSYNCIAWAAEDQSYWWWPDPDHESFWPHGVQRDDSMAAFVAAFRTIGYELCNSFDLEAGFEKVAIYAVGDKVKHMARQLPSGAWTSKLGEWWDIAHDSVDGSSGLAPTNFPSLWNKEARYASRNTPYASAPDGIEIRNKALVSVARMLA